jgi:hypothetical protein
MATWDWQYFYGSSRLDTDNMPSVVIVNTNPASPVPGGQVTVTQVDDSLDVGDQFTFGSTTYTYVGFLEGTGATIWSYEGLEGLAYVILANSNDLASPTAYTVDPVTFPYCLLAGTMVATPSGDRRVEDIRPGDEVLTADGAATAVRWVGRQSLITMFAGRGGVPVMIRAGALGDNLPTADLCVSGDHAIAIDGYLVAAESLINGTTVTRMPEPPAQLDYYHLELDSHRLILANGTPVESFVDDVTRTAFDNYQEWVDLGLEPLPVQALDLPRIKSARQLPTAIADRLATLQLA